MQRLLYIKKVTDRYGKVRLYFNRAGFPRIPLPPEGAKDFIASYQRALGQKEKPRPRNRPVTPIELIDRCPPGSFSDLCRRFYLSSHFIALSGSTKATYRNAIERLRRAHGNKPIADLDRKGVKLILAGLADRPGASNQALRMLRMLMNFAVDEGDRADDPTFRIKKLPEGDGLIPWDEGDIEQFMQHHERGSKAWIAATITLYTAQRRGDVYRMGWGNVRGDRIRVRQRKTKAFLEIPVHPELAEAISLCPKDRATFLVSGWGVPFASAAAYGNWFGDRCREAGMPKGFNSHGLRKAQCRRLAEAGCTAHEIASISGHKTLKEVERYTKGANQVNMASAAMRKVRAAGYGKLGENNPAEQGANP